MKGRRFTGKAGKTAEGTKIRISINGTVTWNGAKRMKCSAAKHRFAGDPSAIRDRISVGLHNSPCVLIRPVAPGAAGLHPGVCAHCGAADRITNEAWKKTGTKTATAGKW